MEPNDEQLKQLQEEFEQTLAFPEKAGGGLPQFVLCPIGIVGAGKSTVMRPLCERLGLLRISGDEIRKFFKERGFGWDRVADVALAIGEKYARRGYSIGVDSDCVRKEKREQIRNIADEVGARVLYIHINPPEEFIIDKLRNFEHTWLFRDGDHAIENYCARKPLHEQLEDLPFVYEFDTSRDDLEQQLDEAVVHIKDVLVA